MLVRTRSGNLHLRTNPGSVEFGQTDPVWMRLQKNRSSAGVLVDSDNAFGIPTVVESIRLAAEAVATAGWRVVDAKSPTEEVTDAWQAELIALPQFTNTFNLFQDISADVDGFGNAFIRKIKANGQVIALQPIDAGRVRVNVDKKTGEVTFDISNGPGVPAVKGLTTDEILHIRGFTISGRYSGISLISAFRQSLGNILAIEEFAGRWWSQSGTTSQVITHPGSLNNSQAEQILEIYEESHTGLVNAGRPALLTGGAKLETVQITAEDAQLINSRNWSVEEIARMCHVPVQLLVSHRTETTKTEDLMSHFQSLYIAPRVARIKAAFNDDPDLFATSPLRLDNTWSEARVIDTQGQGMFDLMMRQGGIMTANEIRAKQGLPPHPDGDQLQITPVGGKANDPKPGSPSPSENADETK